ncbi:MAG: 3-hydroxyacyl-CoA dehydrogenase NAD-binding domain-containing protein [Bryobacteraceae bacterium]
MSELVKLSKSGDVAVITIENPPVNALSPGVPEGIGAAIDAVQGDDSVKAVVVMGGGRTFIAGADIKEFGKITSGQKRGGDLLPLLRKLEDSAKPVIMAIHGTALGGGLEVAMAGHYRVAVASAQVGQPEVKLGIIPGAEGTQRLPRLAGVPMALEMCVGGAPISAAQALECGIVDRIIDGDLLSGAIAFARSVTVAPKTRERKGKLIHDPALFADARESARKKYRGLLAPQAAIDAVEAAATLPFEKACKVEAALFQKCLFSDQSKGMIHAFFGERAVSKIPDIPKDTPLLPIRKAAVIGAGTMGGGIAMNYANAGIPVLLKETTQPALDKGIGTIRRNYENSVKKGRFSQAVMDQRMALITPVLTYDGFGDADIVVEAVFEEMKLKKQIFAEIDLVAKADAILASNTSTLNIDEIASATKRPEMVVGHHFFSPANVMRLLEIVRGRATSKPVLATSMDLAKRLKKVGVLVGNCFGFVGNRMFGPYRREAQFLVEEGAPMEAVDAALYDFGMAMGPLAVGDLAGLDVGWRIRKEIKHLEIAGVRYPFAEDMLAEMGRFGQKTGAGWYRYDEQRRPVPDAEVQAMVAARARETGVPQRSIAAEEMVERTVYALINEGARILEEGIALRAVDIDIIYLQGYGFPAYRGGPMFYADTIGLQKVYDRVRDFGWEPAPLLARLAAAGAKFASLGA